MNYTTRIHPELLEITGAQSPSAAARVALRAAVADGLAPVAAPPSPARRASLYLDRETNAYVRSLAGPDDRVSQVVRDLIWSYHVQQTAQAADPCPPSDKDTRSGRGRALLPENFSRDQLTLFETGQRALDGGGIALLEGSTGIGKSRVVAALARSALMQDRTPVVIAAPTVAVLGQLVEEWVACYGGQPIESSVVLGRSQFVDPDRLQVALDDSARSWALEPGVEDAVREWMRNGAPPVSASSKMLASVDPDIAWLGGDLRAIAPDAPAAALALDPLADADSPAERVYQAQGDCHKASIVWTTQASVASSSKRYSLGWSCRVPAAGTLLVDEAHLLEAAFAAQHEIILSPWGLTHVLRRHEATFRACRCRTHARELARVARRLETTLNSSAAGFRWSPEQTNAHAPSALEKELASFHSAAQPLARKIADRVAESAPALAAYFGRRANALERMTGKNAVAAEVASSPQREYRALRVGPPTVRDPLERLWEHTGAAMCLSATLYVHDINGQPSSGYMAGRLRVPRRRLIAAPPVIADFLTREATLVLPDAERASALCPPGRDSNSSQAWSEYYDAVAAGVARAGDQALGGLLVICTQYADVQAIAARLSEQSDRVIEQKAGTPVTTYRSRFESMDGQRPIWLGTGPVATGMDLAHREVPAGEDTRLTDVVIVRLPFGWQSSTTLAAQTRTRLVFQETAMTFRQMCGRLVRRPGTPGRRLWVLDGRMVSSKSSHIYTTQLCRQVIRKYPYVIRW